MLFAHCAWGAIPAPPDLRFATYARVIEYFRKLASATGHLRLSDIGSSGYGQPMFAAVVGPNGPNPSRRAVLEFGAGESQEAADRAYELLSRPLPRDLFTVIALKNPDGMDLLADWHRQNFHSPYEAAPLPRLIQRYSGSEGDQDSYTLNLRESRNFAAWLHPPEPRSIQYLIPAKQWDQRSAMELLMRLAWNGAEIVRRKSDGAYLASGGERLAAVVNTLRLPDLMNVAVERAYGVFDTERATLELPAAPHRAKPPRVGIYEPWFDNPDTGWTEWMLDQYDIPYTPFHNEDFAKDDLFEMFDVIVMGAESRRLIMHGDPAQSRPDYAGGIGVNGTAHLEHFAKRGGVLITLGAACELPLDQFGIPLQSAPVNAPFARVLANDSSPLASGMPGEFWASAVDGFAFEESPLARSAVRFKSGGVGVAEVKYGQGKIVLFGIRPQFQGRTFGSFKLLLNAIFTGPKA